MHENRYFHVILSQTDVIKKEKNTHICAHLNMIFFGSDLYYSALNILRTENYCALLAVRMSVSLNLTFQMLDKHMGCNFLYPSIKYDFQQKIKK